MRVIRHDYEVICSPDLWPEGDGGAVPEERILSTYEACRWLNVDRTTLKRWAEKTKVRSVEVPYDDRVSGWKESELRKMFTEMRPGYRLKPYSRDETMSVRELRADLDALRTQLEAHIASHAFMAPTASPEAQQPRVERAKGVTVRLPERGDTLPEGYEAVSVWAKDHKIPLWTVEHAIKHGNVPEPHKGRWKRGRAFISNAWDEEQQAAALRYWQQLGRIS